MSRRAGIENRLPSERADRSTLEDELASGLSGEVAIVGVGDPGRGDDGAGPMLVTLLAAAGVPNVIDAGASPEHETWRIRRAAPGTVLFVDAVDIGAAPGAVSLLRAGDLRTEAYDTHRAPLRLTMEYLESELGCSCRLLAVQPRDVSPAPMSDEVRAAVEVLAEILAERCGRAADRSDQ